MSNPSFTFEPPSPKRLDPEPTASGRNRLPETFPGFKFNPSVGKSGVDDAKHTQDDVGPSPVADLPQEVLGVISTYCIPSGVRFLRSCSTVLSTKIAQSCQDRYIPIIIMHNNQATMVLKYFYGLHKLVHCGNCACPPMTTGGGKAQPAKPVEADCTDVIRQCLAVLAQTPDWLLETEEDVQRWESVIEGRGLLPTNQGAPRSKFIVRGLEVTSTVFAASDRIMTPQEMRTVAPFFFVYGNIECAVKALENMCGGETGESGTENKGFEILHCSRPPQSLPTENGATWLPGVRLPPQYFLQGAMPKNDEGAPVPWPSESYSVIGQPGQRLGGDLIRSNEKEDASSALKALMRYAMFAGASQPVTISQANRLGAGRFCLALLTQRYLAKVKSGTHETDDQLKVLCPQFARLLESIGKSNARAFDGSDDDAVLQFLSTTTNVKSMKMNAAGLGNNDKACKFRRFSPYQVKSWSKSEWHQQLTHPFMVSKDHLSYSHTEVDLGLPTNESVGLPKDAALTIAGVQSVGGEKVRLHPDQLEDLMASQGCPHPHNHDVNSAISPNTFLYVADTDYLSIRHIDALYSPRPWLVAPRGVVSSIYHPHNGVVKPPPARKIERGPPTAPEPAPIDTPWILMGPSQSWSSEHQEPEGSNVWCHLKYGTKSWYILEDNGEEGPVGWYSVRQEAGDTMFLPPTAIHLVVNEQPSFAIARNFYVA